MKGEKDQYSLEFKQFIRTFLIAIFITSIILLVFLLLFSDQLKFLNKFMDIVGILAGTIFAVAGIILLFMTLWEQRRVLTRERFESRLFNMIRDHRQNVDEFNIRNRVTGGKCFKQMIHEFRHIYKLALAARELPEYRDTFDRDEDLVDFSYKIFFFGTDLCNGRSLKKSITNKELRFFTQFVEPKLLEIQDAYLHFRSRNVNDPFEWWRPNFGKKEDWYFEINYYPLSGHSEGLKNYNRHLFESVNFVAGYMEEYGYEAINDYLKVLSAQLSGQEQLLLYYYSLSDFGKQWHEFNYFSDYCFLKTLPVNLTGVSPKPGEKIGITNKYGNKIFESDETIDAVK